MADLPGSERVVGVVAHQCGHVERHREARLALREEELVAAVRLLRGTGAREMPKTPPLFPIKRGVDPPPGGENARKTPPLPAISTPPGPPGVIAAAGATH